MSSATPRSRRQRPVSCQFCRSRKLRCSRTQPCSNCSARGISCRMEPLSPHPEGTDPVQADILVRLQRLEHIIAAQHPGENAAAANPPATMPTGQPRPSLHHDIAWLERVSMGQTTKRYNLPDTIIFNTGPIKDLPSAPTYVSPPSASREPVRCIWLPQLQESKILIERYMRDASYMKHIVHLPSLANAIDNIYLHLDTREPAHAGSLALLLAVIASVTYTWTIDDNKPSLFSSSIEANSQTPFWIKAAQDTVDAAQRSSCLSLEIVQAIILVAFVIGNQECMSFRFRSMLTNALLISRELGLHRYDLPSDSVKENFIDAEVSRRVWWYLVATDWLLALRSGGHGESIYQCNPAHMLVRKPCNINDEDLCDSVAPVGRPLSQPTNMSYSLQRIRLAEISRSLVDRHTLAMSSTKAESHADVLAIDVELDRFMDELPPFLNMDKIISNPYMDFNSSCLSPIHMQAYMLNGLAHIQRCKLHLPYLTSDSKFSTHTLSREKCIKAAKLIFRDENWLEKQNHPFVSMRLKFSGMLYGVFLATIVLLVDMCINKPGPQTHCKELADSCRILKAARHQSQAASNLLDSLMYYLKQHKRSAPHLGVPESGAVGNIDGESLEDMIAPTNESTYTSGEGGLHLNDVASGWSEWIEPDRFPWSDFLDNLGTSSFF